MPKILKNSEVVKRRPRCNGYYMEWFAGECRECELAPDCRRKALASRDVEPKRRRIFGGER